MKYLIFSLFFHSSYVFAQATEPVPVADVKCGFGWVQCDNKDKDKDVDTSGSGEKKITFEGGTPKEDYSKIDVSKLKTDIKSLYGEAAFKEFESRQGEIEAFCLSDVMGEQTEVSEQTHKAYTNYLISGDKVIGVCSTTAAASGNTKKEVKKETAQPIVTAAVAKGKTCGQLITEAAKTVIGKNRAWGTKFVELDCKGTEFNLGQLGSNIGENPIVKETMKVCGYTSLAQWRYKGDKTRKVCGDPNLTKPVDAAKGSANGSAQSSGVGSKAASGAKGTVPKKVDPNQPVCAKGSFNCEDE